MLTHHNLRCMLTTCCLCMLGRYMWPWRVPSLLNSASPLFEASGKVGAHVLVQHREIHKVQLLQSRQMLADVPPTKQSGAVVEKVHRPPCKVAAESHTNHMSDWSERPCYHTRTGKASTALCLLVVGVLCNRVAMQSHLPQVLQRAELLNLCQKGASLSSALALF